MTDLSKVADIVLLLIDASYGFEMETFEFLNQLQIHGFPKVIGIMTHLDGFLHKNKMLKVPACLLFCLYQSVDMFFKFSFVRSCRIQRKL